MAKVKSDKPLYIGQCMCSSCEWIQQFSEEEVKAFTQEKLNEARTKCANCRTEFKFDINFNKYVKGSAKVPAPKLSKGKKWKMDKALLRTMLILRDSGHTYKQISEVTGKSYATVVNTLSLGYKNEETNNLIRKYMLDVGFVPPNKAG